MYALLSLVVCLAAQPYVCETVIPSYVRAGGEPPTFFECQGAVGQEIAGMWLAEHPQYELRKIRCSLGSNPDILRNSVEQPEA